MPFQFYKAGHFSPSFSLSHAHIELEPMKNYTTAARLFNINSVEQYKEKIAPISEQAQKLFALFDDVNIDLSFATHTSNEKETFKLIAKSVLQKLGDVVLDKHQFGTSDDDPPYEESASSSRRKTESLKSEWLGIGTTRTWHGYPNARFRIGSNDTSLLAHHDDLVDADESPGDSVAIEAKVQITEDKLMQLVPTAVIAAFIEKNLHPELCPMTPTILLTPTRAMICIYVVSRDFLLITEPFNWIRKDQEKCVFDKIGFLLLWMALNHR